MAAASLEYYHDAAEAWVLISAVVLVLCLSCRQMHLFVTCLNSYGNMYEEETGRGEPAQERASGTTVPDPRTLLPHLTRAQKLAVDPALDPPTEYVSCFSNAYARIPHGSSGRVMSLGDAYTRAMDMLGTRLPPKVYSFAYDRSERWVQSVCMNRRERTERDMQRHEYAAIIHDVLAVVLQDDRLSGALRHALRADGDNVWHTSDERDVEIYVLSSLLWVRAKTDLLYRTCLRELACKNVTVVHAGQCGVHQDVCTYALKYMCEHGSAAARWKAAPGASEREAQVSDADS